jgi:hypothetical protein
MSHLSFMLSLMMILQQCHIFAPVPPHWEDLVRSPATIEMYEEQIGTWQSIPNIEIEQGDFSGKKPTSIHFYLRL